MTSGARATTRRHRLRPPALGSADVERPRLSHAIHATSPSGTCILTAPPGYGATTAVAQALTGNPGLAWISLDGLDGSPDRFTAQLSAALAGWGLPPDDHVATGDPGSLERIAQIVEWLESSPCEWLVLDGFDAQAHGAWADHLRYLVGNLPTSMRLALTSHDALRRMPVDAASRLLQVLDARQLQAVPDEAATIALACSPSLPMDAVEAIAVTADGWIAAVRAAARHAAAHPESDPAHWLMTEGASDLIDPWLNRLDPELRAFLADTSCLDTLSAPLCDEVLQIRDSQAHLEELESHGGYLHACTQSLPQTREVLRWWCRHPLVTTALARRTALEDSSERHLRAAAWFQAEGDFDATMSHLVASGQLDEAGQYLSAHENALFEQGRGHRAAAWYASLPPDAWGEIGWHLVRVAWGEVLTSQTRTAQATVAQLRAHLANSTPDDPAQELLMAEAELLTAYLAYTAGDSGSVITAARRAIDLSGPQTPINSQQIAPALLARALLWEGEVAEARRELGRVEFRHFPPGMLRESVLAAVEAQCLVDEGRILEALARVRSAQDWLARQRLHPEEVSQYTLMTAAAAAELESGDPVTALAALSRTADHAQESGTLGEAALALAWQARSEVALGRLGEALASVTRARRLISGSAPTSRIVGRLDLTEAFIRHVAGDPLRAERLVQGAPASEARTLMWARVTMHRQTSGVRQALTTITTQTPRLATDKQVLLATAALRRSRTMAEGYLMRAADIAVPHGLHFALLGAPIELVDLAHAVAFRSSHDGLLRLAAAVRTPPVLSPDEPEQRSPASPATGVPLSAGELQLLTFLPRRDSNAEIARQLGVSVNTVKTRLYRLYRKLDVDNRDAAIEVARRRGLLT